MMVSVAFLFLPSEMCCVCGGDMRVRSAPHVITSVFSVLHEHTLRACGWSERATTCIPTEHGRHLTHVHTRTCPVACTPWSESRGRWMDDVIAKSCE